LISPLTAILPDRVPVGIRGAFATLFGIGMMVGGLAGQVLGSLFVTDIMAGYVLLAGVMIVGVMLFVIFARDSSSLDLEREPFNVKAVLRTFWVNPIAHPDFFWGFAGRMLLYTGYFIATGYQLYILRDYIGQSESASNVTIGVMSTIQLVTLILSSVVSGYLSDKFQARKPFVFFATIVMAVSYLVPLFWRTESGMLVMAAVLGLGYGAYMSIDMALMTQVLPNDGENAGKDMGVLTIATNLPQMLTQPIVAVLLTISSGSYVILFVWAIVLVFVSSLLVLPIKSVK
jgi:MFS family permease